jgi:flagellar biosynthesis regulator FlbT
MALARVFERGTIVPLRVELKPFERIVIGETVLVNSGTRTSFLIDGDAPILRERDTITPRPPIRRPSVSISAFRPCI